MFQVQNYGSLTGRYLLDHSINFGFTSFALTLALSYRYNNVATMRYTKKTIPSPEIASIHFTIVFCIHYYCDIYYIMVFNTIILFIARYM